MSNFRIGRAKGIDKRFSLNPQEFLNALYEYEKKLELEILSVTDDDVLTNDFYENRIINYHLKPPTKEWIGCKIEYMPSTECYKDIYHENIVDLLASIDPNMLITLQHIFIMSADSDIETACKIVDAWNSDFPDEIDFKEHYSLGCLWHQYSSIIVDMGAIKQAVQEMERDAIAGGMHMNTGEEEAIGLFTTLTHEVRHLGFSNPFLDDDDYPESLDTEGAVEQWGIEAYEAWMYKI